MPDTTLKIIPSYEILQNFELLEIRNESITIKVEREHPYDTELSVSFVKIVDDDPSWV